ncbi:MAG TPA: M15 family metallopeptidase [Polyangia bacterium]|nr:M15 family metallopeptidase [Polyangia bacterium]
MAPRFVGEQTPGEGTGDGRTFARRAPSMFCFALLIVATASRAGAQEPPPAPGPPLPWVNPARCLPRCAAEPDAPLTRLDDRGRLARAGKHRVAAAAVAPLQVLLADAQAAGFRLRISSAFRSYKEQARLFRTIKERGRAARPGHSEHQLGTTIDLRLPSTKAILWLADHAGEHGFALSYPPGQQRVTGYRPEPWHVRYVGPALGRELHDRGMTLEQLFRSRPGLGVSGDCTDCPDALSRSRCGRLTVAGTCEGTVLSWCYDGAANAVDCSQSKEVCRPATNDREAACATAEPGAPAPK